MQMEAIALDELGKPAIDLERCIGCALCVTTCPSDALRLEKSDSAKAPPDDTRALYMKLLQERYGSLGMAKVAARKALGMKF